MQNSCSYRAVLIGTGTMGGRHRRLFEEVGVEFSGLADSASEAETLFENLTTGRFQVDFAVVASPALTHFDYARRLLELRIPTLVEKPLAVTATEADLLREISLSKGVPLFVGHSERYNPAVKDFVQGDFFRGMRPPLKFRFERTHGYSDRNHDVSVELDLMVHDFDLLHYFVGNLVPTSAQVLERTENRTVVVMDFKGLQAEFVADRNCSRDCRCIAVSTDNSSVNLDLAAYRNENPAYALQREHEAFLHCLEIFRAGGDFPWAENLAGACNAVALASLIETSALERKNEVCIQ